MLWTLYRSNLIAKFTILNFAISLPGIQNSQMLSVGKHTSHFSPRLAELTACYPKAKPCPIDLFAVSDAIFLGAQTQQNKRVTACHSNAKPCPIDVFAVSDAILPGAQTQQKLRKCMRKFKHQCPISKF